LTRLQLQNQQVKVQINVDRAIEGEVAGVTLVLRGAQGQALTEASGSVGPINKQGSKVGTLTIDVPCSAPPEAGTTIDVTVNPGRDACGAAWAGVEFEGVGGGFGVAAATNIAMDPTALSIAPGGDLVAASCFSATYNARQDRVNTYPGELHFKPS
jgi:hypothetical protein